MKTKHLWFIMLLSLLIFISVTFIFTVQNGFLYDHSIANFISNNVTQSVHNIMKSISLIGSSEVILLITGLIGFVFLVKKDWYHLFLFFIISVGGVFVNLALKLIFRRERPGGEIKHIDVFNYSFDIPSYSFPSGHTMRITILLLFLIYLIGRFLLYRFTKVTLYMLCIFLMFAIAGSRLFVEAHYLSDTIAAMSISVAWFCLCLLFFKRFDRKQIKYHQVIGK